MRLLFWIFGRFMRNVENQMIKRLLSQRDQARQEIDVYRNKLGMKLGEF